ncbi:MAG: N-acetylmuramic acid 6-phosphate etherase [Lachnospiraceae bacterium]|jgi:N-acetylmuramic acid 6-phosphate etherase
MSIKLDELVTETRNQDSINLDKVSTLDMLKIINNADKIVPLVVEKQIEKIAEAVEAATKAVKQGGRLLYLGAGTSGRLGILDAVECRPTYGVDDDVVQGLIAGGYDAMFRAKEGAEDSKELGRQDLKNVNLTDKDLLIGIAASGRTPYVLGGMEYARELGTTTVAIVCNEKSEMADLADIAIEAVVGPEVVTGSTRMKAGTAQKLILNMISTCTMVKIGKVYSNLMVDVKASNLKLVERAKKIVMECTGCTLKEAEETLKAADYEVTLAILMLKTGLDCGEAAAILEQHGGRISESIASI